MIYLSGSLTNGGTKEIDPTQFNEAEKKLIEQGHEVFNPASLEQKEKKPWEWYLARDLDWIGKHRPIMYMLPGWEQSQGARLEWEYASRIGLKIIYESINRVDEMNL